MLHADVALHRFDPDRPRPSGEHMLVRGISTPRAEWESLSRIEQRRLVVRARLETLRADGIVSHRSAAALWGLPDLGPLDDRLHLIDPRARSTHSGRGVVRHAASIRAADVVRLDGVVATAALRTVVDVLRTESFEYGVITLDHALRLGLVERDAVQEELERVGGGRGTARAARVVEFADPRSESPGESSSRVRFRELRIPAPELQRTFVTDVGRFRVDFWWPRFGVIGEFDGRVKYQNGDPDALWKEKRREDALRRDREVSGLARWVAREVHDSARMSTILRRAGVVHQSPRHPGREQ